MRQVIRHIILLTTLLLLEVTSLAQGVSTFPVQVTTQVMSPSVYLTDYESGFEERVSVILLNRDVMSTGVDVRLRLTIKCQNGLTLRTKPSAVFEAISLYPGSPERLGMSDLSPYFDVRNLDVNGSLVQGMLPEGLATFTFEAVEYHTGVVVSTQGVAVTNLTMNKPPALLFPMDRSVINSRAAQSVLFQWQPRHTYTQEGVTYEITLKEITDTLANPTSAYNYSQSIYQTETTGTSLIYSVSEPPLEAGKRYGWCVRAYRADGTGGSFTNGGYSEVFTFDVRETPLDNQTDVKDSISDTPVKKQEKDYSHCGEDNYRVTNLTPTDALEVGDTITVGGGFNVVLTTLRQSGYLYSGEGYMYIPYVGLTFAVDFNGIKVNTDKQLIEGYTEVRRDASKAQIGGTDAILQGGANRLKNGVLLPDVTVDFNMEDASGADYDSVSNTVTVYDEEGSKVGSFTVPQNETGESVFPVTVKDKVGNIVRIDEETDADGKPTGKYKFTPLGSQSAGQYISEQTLSTLRSDLGSVDFEEDADGIYTFDQPLDYYETVSLLLNSDGANGGGRIYRKVSGYDVPWLFIEEGGTESVRANLTLTKSGKSEIKHPENITFIINDEGGVITLPSEYDAADNTYSVRVSASQADSRQTVYALYQSGDQSHTLGQLDVDTRAPLTAKVCLVNLGGKYDKSRIETNINAIYQRVGVTWSVEEENGFMYPKEELESLFDKKSGALELYNENQKSLNKAFEAYLGDRYDGKTCYLFMMPANGSDSKRDLAGFMPRGEQYGYINTDVILQEQMPAVIAHELGHGKFRLRHTFDSEYGKGAESKKGKTDNLMDYAPTPSSATHIAKWQWNQIHNPALLTELWEKDEDSEWAIFAKYGVDVFINASLQMVLAYMFDDTVQSWAEAWNKVNMYQALVDGAIDQISFKKTRYALSFAWNLSSCLYEREYINENAMLECGLLGVLDIAAGETIERYGIPAFKAGLKKIGLNTDKIQAILKNADAPDFSSAEVKDIDKATLKGRIDGIPSKIGMRWVNVIGKRIDTIENPPEGYSFFTHNGKKFIRRIDAKNPETPQLTVKDGIIVRYDGKTIKEFTKEQIETIVFEATKNPEAKKVMLGKYSPKLNEISYDRTAGNEYSYYELDNWNSLYSLVDENFEQMFRINEQFIRNQFSLGKSFYFSHNPLQPEGHSYPQEINLLKQLVKISYGKEPSFIKEGTLWKLTW